MDSRIRPCNTTATAATPRHRGGTLTREDGLSLPFAGFVSFAGAFFDLIVDPNFWLMPDIGLTWSFPYLKTHMMGMQQLRFEPRYFEVKSLHSIRT